ncbi:hypothetical protein CDAR_270781 [Caerostris darwini]|uniref:Uncharacterized protein n=1 Tax=Caerostris darwini TaxID=1538125 RepID=A0AAV4TCZ7_9ARAC|nr:hypothetical protein CDAR_270781 [Caerostris darwini]
MQKDLQSSNILTFFLKKEQEQSGEQSIAFQNCESSIQTANNASVPNPCILEDRQDKSVSGIFFCCAQGGGYNPPTTPKWKYCKSHNGKIVLDPEQDEECSDNGSVLFCTNGALLAE